MPYEQYEYTSRRIAGGRVDLAPPLTLTWALRGGSTGALVSGTNIACVVEAGRADVACLDAAGTIRWRKRSLEPFAFLRSTLIAATDRASDARCRVVLLRADDGELLDRSPLDHYPIALLETSERLVVVCEPEKRPASIGVLALTQGLPKLWMRGASDFGAKPEEWFRFVAGDRGRLFITLGSRILALSEDDGTVLWAVDLGAHSGVADCVVEQPMIVDRLVVVGGGGMVFALDVASGAVVWRREVPSGSRVVYGQRVHVVAGLRYFALDLSTGEVLLEADIGEAMRRVAGRRIEKHTRPAVSETHLFLGDITGRLWAFNVATGDPDWHEKPPGADCFLGAFPAISDRRLYVPSYSFGKGETHLYCYEEASAATSESRAGRVVSSSSSSSTTWQDLVAPAAGRRVKPGRERVPG